MTATTDSAGHPEVTEISDLTEGVLPPSRTSAVRRHLDGCELCADVYASLEEIRGMLGTLPGPAPMPADIAGRIDAALAAEALLNATTPDDHVANDHVAEGPVTGAPDAGAAEPAVAPSATSGAARVSRETSPVSSPGPSADRPAGRPRAATGPGRGKQPRRSRRRTAVFGAVFTAAAIGLGSLLIQAVGDDGSTSTSAGRSESADTFSGKGLKGQVADLLAKNPPKESRRENRESPEKSDGSKESFSPRSSPQSPDDAPLRTTTAQVPECIQRGIGDRTPLAAEEGSYEGKRAYLVVVPHDSDATQVSAYIVDAACVGKSSPSAGKVLLTHSYPQG
ncbi:anti-sigma factor family protein [Streptomyces flavofungini]|uniref:anti-sigma factor family protein n=1 Tax=Streptomyces flavofungini TaxID=68200 RepID=UPI0034DE9FFE